MTDPCKFERELIVALAEMPEIKTKLDDIVSLLKGVNDSKPGLVHRVLANSTSISRQWKFIFPISTLLILGFVKVMFF